jgi:hypothetical protein
MMRALLGLGVLLVGLALSCARRPLILEAYPTDQAVGEPGWMLSGGGRDVYYVHRDTQGDRGAWLLEPARDTYGKYGTWMRSIDAGAYRSKRVRITATLKTQGATKRVDFWARAQAKTSPGDGPGLGGDSKQLPADSSWRQDVIVMDVPPETDQLQYGVGVAGPGKVWIESTKLEIVGQDVPLTDKTESGSGRVSGWMLAGDDVPEYAIGIDSSNHRSGRASGSLRSLVPNPRGFGTLMQSMDPAGVAGKRLRLSTYVKSESVSGWAGVWMRVDGPNGKRSTAFDNMQDRPIVGTTDWTRYEVVLDVAADSENVAFGVLLHGSGRVLIDDVAFEVVSTDVPTTDKKGRRAKGPANLDFEQ